MIRKFVNSLWARWANIPWFARFLILTTAALLLWLSAVSPTYEAFKVWRMERHLVAARKAVEDERMNDAYDLSMTVLRSGARSIEALRIFEEATASLCDPRHPDVAWALFSNPESSPADRLRCFRGIARDAAMGTLAQARTMLTIENRRDPRFATAIADRLIAEQSLTEAGAALLAVPEAARVGEVDRRLARILIGCGHQGKGYAEAQRFIAAKMPTDGSDLAEWLDLLEEIPALSLRADWLEPVRKGLAAPPHASEARPALMLARIDYAENPGRREAILEEAIGRWKDREPQALADFLGALGCFERLLEVFPPEILDSHPEMLPRMLQTMEQSGHWDRLVLVLDAHGDHLPKFEEFAHLALSAAKTGDSAASVEAWHAAMAEAGNSPLATAYLTLHRIMSEAGMQGEAEEALVAAIRRKRGPLPLYANLKPLLDSLARQGSDDTLLAICSSYLSFEPGNTFLLSQFAYLACLADLVEPKTLLKTLQTLSPVHPDDSVIQCVLATVYLCDGQAAMAAEMFDRLPIAPGDLVPGYHAAFLTSQVLAHRITKNDPRITGFPWKSLLPSEREKFSKLIRTAKR